MKKLLILILVISTLPFSSCKKKDDCEANNTGKVLVENNSSNPYILYVNDGFIYNIYEGGSYTFEGKAGVTYNFKLKQKSGYVIYPSIFTEQIFITQCDTKYWEVHDSK